MNDQQSRALARARRTRSARTEFARRLRGMDPKLARAEVAEALAAPNGLGRVKVAEVLMACPRLGRVRVDRLLADASISPLKRLEELSDKQRAALAAMVRDGRRAESRTRRLVTVDRARLDRVVLRNRQMRGLLKDVERFFLTPPDEDRRLVRQASLVERIQELCAE